MSSFSSHPDQTHVLMEGLYPLTIDVQKAPKTSIECRLCHRKTVEGEPLLTFYLEGDYKLRWTRSYCGLCAGRWTDQTVATMQHARGEIEKMVAKLGESFYVAKDMFGKDVKEVLKNIASEKKP